ncbi:hypothetical protein L1987_24255 [Smallanthus sonchifolius]|uniref:Uncharacterized protein n=1 Tax=Smallanthus sonchifolius TaxID=185202 RepID=A0ACB9ILE7_9ASTR|nr:hypothetical protein L1987_24255 [Smallanthus sonchifolius]
METNYTKIDHQKHRLFGESICRILVLAKREFCSDGQGIVCTAVPESSLSRYTPNKLLIQFVEHLDKKTQFHRSDKEGIATLKILKHPNVVGLHEG